MDDSAARSIGIKALRPLQFTGSVSAGYQRRGCLISRKHTKKRELTTVEDVEFFWQQQFCLGGGLCRAMARRYYRLLKS